MAPSSIWSWCAAGPACRVFVSEPAPERLRLALALGATEEPERSHPDDDGGGDGTPPGFSLVVDAAGYPQSLAAACAGAANGGTVLVVALSSAAVPLVPAQLAERSLSIVGSIGFDDELAEAVLLLASGPDAYRPLVSEAVLLEEAAERLATLTISPSAGKVVVRPWQD